MSLINQPEIDRICRAYSDTNAEYAGVSSRKEKITNLMDAEFSKLQTLFRRTLSKSLRLTGASVMHPRVWALIAHGKKPVTVTPIASVTICVRQGVEIRLSFVATEENIRNEVRRVAFAIADLDAAA